MTIPVLRDGERLARRCPRCAQATLVVEATSIASSVLSRRDAASDADNARYTVQCEACDARFLLRASDGQLRLL